MKPLVSKMPFFRTKKNTKKIMLEFFVVLNLIWFASILIHFINFGPKAAQMTFLIGFVSYVTTFFLDACVAYFRKERLNKIIGENFSYISAIIFALTLPAGTPLYVVFVGAVITTYVSKYLFGGFGFNVFNPAAVGRVFVGIAFGSRLLPFATLSNDLSTSPTVTSSIDWSFVSENSYSLSQLFLGGYPSAIGESFFMFLLLAFIYLVMRGIINYRASFYYLLTIVLCAATLSLFIDNVGVIEYIALHLMSGAIMFAAVFMISDPVTTGRRNFTKVLYGIGAGFLTIFIRINSSYPEGVIYSILIMNMIVPLLESLKYKKELKFLSSKKVFAASLIVILVILNTFVTVTQTFREDDTIFISKNSMNLIYDLERGDHTYG